MNITHIILKTLLVIVILTPPMTLSILMTGFWETLVAMMALTLILSWLLLTFFSPVLFCYIDEGKFEQITKKIFAGTPSDE